jgi:hypothetical protein
MEFFPHNSSILVECIQKDIETKVIDGIQVTCHQIPLYKVISIGENKDLPYGAGDIVTSDSTGTQLKLDGRLLSLFDVNKIIGKVE